MGLEAIIAKLKRYVETACKASEHQSRRKIIRTFLIKQRLNKESANELSTYLKSKFAKGAITFALGTSLICAPLLTLNKKAAARPYRRTLFSYQDYRGDDKGPGYYTYPYNRKFIKGSFDITQFIVKERGHHLIFDIFFRQGTKAKNQAIDIYIDMDHKYNSGTTDALLGRNVQFSPESAWEKLILITPEQREGVLGALRKNDHIQNIRDLRDKIIVPYHVAYFGNRVRALVHKYYIEKPSKNWGFQVLSMGYSPFVDNNNFKNISVDASSSYFNFGGGDNYHGDPNVIDLLGDNSGLRNYVSRPDPSQNKFAVIDCVYRGEE